MAGIDQLKNDVIALAKLLNAGSLMLHNQGLIGALWDAIPNIKTVISTDWAEFKLEAADLDSDEKAQLETSFCNALNFVDKDVENKIKGSVSAIDEGLGYIQEGIALVKHVMDYALRIKAMLAPKA